jgi:PASTA domain
MLVLGCAGIAPADAAGLPQFDGVMTFPSIQGPADPEEYSWEVTLEEGQALEAVDEKHAQVYYVDDHQTAFAIAAVAAHDADGISVPTSLAVSEGSVITLTVHHRAGNPAAAGTPFDYPVIVGEGWSGGFVTEVVPGPKDEQELREERERKEREELEALRRSEVRPRGCRVPELRGRRLVGSMRALRRANCTVGQVWRRKGATAKTGQVVKQSPRPGTLLGSGAQVNVVLGKD